MMTKSEAGVYTARGVGELGQMVSNLAQEGFRIVTVIDTQNGDYHVVAQREIARQCDHPFCGDKCGEEPAPTPLAAALAATEVQALVECAYREGWADGSCNHNHRTMTQDWLVSDAFAAPAKGGE